MSSGNIVPFPIPKSTELSTWLEEHVAAPTTAPPQSRLLRITSVPHPDQDPKGMLVFNHCDTYRIGRPFLELSYEITPIAMPEWWYPNLERKAPGNWFVLRIGPFPNAAFTEIPIRQESEARRPQEFCPNCHTEWMVFIDQDNGKAICSDCAGYRYPAALYEDRIVLFSREAPTRKRKQLGRCVRCGFYRSAPIHNAKSMRGNPIGHEFTLATVAP